MKVLIKVPVTLTDDNEGFVTFEADLYASILGTVNGETKVRRIGEPIIEIVGKENEN